MCVKITLSCGDALREESQFSNEASVENVYICSLTETLLIRVWDALIPI